MTNPVSITHFYDINPVNITVMMINNSVSIIPFDSNPVRNFMPITLFALPFYDSNPVDITVMTVTLLALLELLQ